MWHWWFCLAFSFLTGIKHRHMKLSVKRFSWGQTLLRKTGCPALFQNASYFIACFKNKRVFLCRAPWDPVGRQSWAHKGWMAPVTGSPWSADLKASVTPDLQCCTSHRFGFPSWCSWFSLGFLHLGFSSVDFKWLGHFKILAHCLWSRWPEWLLLSATLHA